MIISFKPYTSNLSSPDVAFSFVGTSWVLSDKVPRSRPVNGFLLFIFLSKFKSAVPLDFLSLLNETFIL